MRTQPPTREDVRERIEGLLASRYTRRDVSAWAHQWVAAWDPQVADDAVWRALTALAGADTPAEPDGYLYYEPDFHAWLDELENADF